MATLYELTGIAQDLAALLDRPDLAPEDRLKAGVLQDELLEGLLPAKVESYCHVIAGLAAEAEMFAAEAARLRDRGTAKANEATRLKDRLRDALAAGGLEKVKAGVWNVALQNSPPSVKVTDEKALPADCWKQPAPVLDKAEIGARLKAGTAVPGAELVQSKHLRIR